MTKEVLILFGADENGNLNGFDDTFEFLSYTLYEDNKEIGSCGLMPSGTVNNGTQEGCMEGIYEVDLVPDEKVIYHNNENGKEYSKQEFVHEFCGNEKWKKVNDWGYLVSVLF